MLTAKKIEWSLPEISLVHRILSCNCAASNTLMEVFVPCSRCTDNFSCASLAIFARKSCWYFPILLLLFGQVLRTTLREVTIPSNFCLRLRLMLVAIATSFGTWTFATCSCFSHSLALIFYTCTFRIIIIFIILFLGSILRLGYRPRPTRQA